jgi:tRNA(adenine34) deaminase
MRKPNSHQKGSDRRWVAKVKTVSTFPPQGVFTKDAQTIARSLASKKVSPKGIGSGIRMIQYFINRAGKGLSPTRRRELEKAKTILHERLEAQNGQKKKRGSTQDPHRDNRSVGGSKAKKSATRSAR